MENITIAPHERESLIIEIKHGVRKYVEDSGGRIRLYPLPLWSPDSNQVEVVWSLCMRL